MREQEILHLAQSAIAGGRQMAREQVAEGEVVRARLQVKSLGEEVPTSELLSAGSAVRTVARNGLLGGGLGDEANVELVESDLASALGDSHTQTTREQSTGRVAGVAIADQRRRFYQDLELSGWLCKLVLAETLLGPAGASQAAALVLTVVSVGVDQVVHGEG
jgi:hypothetical protein